MPRFFDDYSNTYLTHDSAAGRKQQRRGWKFRENFKLHYEKHMQAWRSGHMGLASAQQAFTRQTGQKPPLPDGWTEDHDEVTKASFYSNEETGERSWVRPGFIPPGQGGAGPPPMNCKYRYITVLCISGVWCLMEYLSASLHQDPFHEYFIHCGSFQNYFPYPNSF